MGNRYKQGILSKRISNDQKTLKSMFNILKAEFLKIKPKSSSNNSNVTYFISIELPPNQSACPKSTDEIKNIYNREHQE